MSRGEAITSEVVAQICRMAAKIERSDSFPSPFPAASPAGGEGPREARGRGESPRLRVGLQPSPGSLRSPPSPPAGEAAGRGEGKEESTRPWRWQPYSGTARTGGPRRCSPRKHEHLRHWDEHLRGRHEQIQAPMS